MIPIHELLSRIRWDKEFARGEFKIGYYDRLADRIIQVPFTDLVFPKDDHFAFLIWDEDGEVHSIPYHRVREVYKDGRLIWHRKL
ncbi:DUF504 domain-containing protein [Thiohalobacter sp. IOR34]|uniref:DUF504 domain-containing protein n=1 Tax=Thiohalobacter sp. IOR34 TaxID=3057176 RepID=UPI0025B262E3|nr:DUF504 domain-containing protein [Thiohalobacter sp. IOR34]WJW76411.1 DUF504 domain-containing protein [Thiohalobacter sp. IOR34]